MKEILFEFYKPADSELKVAWDTGLFTFDSNVLLNLYRYSSKTTDELFDILKHLKSKVWLSNQAGYEYLNNRLTVIQKQKIAYDEIQNLLSKKLDEIANDLNLYKKHPTIEVDPIKDSIKKSFETIQKEIKELGKSHPKYEPTDSIRDEVTKLFSGKIGKSFTKDRLNEIFKEGQSRYENEVPPGYKDRSNKKDSPKQSLYGDLILWKQIIENAKSSGKPTILVTDDLKEDWWDKFKGETQGPRKELLREFFEETGQKIYIYQADKFLEYANKLNIGKTVKKETIEEIRKVRVSDELFMKETTSLAERISKLVDTQQKYFYSDDYKKFIEKYAGQQSIFNIDSELIKKLQESVNTYKGVSALPPINNTISYPFTEQQKATMKKWAELYTTKTETPLPPSPTDSDTSDKPKE